MLAQAKTETAPKLYTYEDYYSWGEDAERCELIDGVVYAMAAPTIAHQSVAGNLYYEMRNFFKGRKCTPYIAPFDVRLNPRGLDNTVVQPDVFVVCDPKELSDGKSCQGAPDLVVEVLSPASSRLDKKIKFKKYEQAGVREYWLVDPVYRTVEVFILETDKYALFDFFDTADEAIASSIFDEMKILTADIFEPEETESSEAS